MIHVEYMKSDGGSRIEAPNLASKQVGTVSTVFWSVELGFGSRKAGKGQGVGIDCFLLVGEVGLS